MRRRELLRMIGATAALAAAPLVGLAAPLRAGLRRSVARARQVPADLLARIRRRTRPLDERDLGKEHDLAG